MKNKNLSLYTSLLASLLFACTGCVKDAKGNYVLKPAIKGNIQLALKQLGVHAVAIAQRTVDAFAQSELDALLKNHFVQSSGDLLRTLEDSAVTSASAELAPTVQQQLEQWLPDKSHWQNYATQIGALLNDFSKQHPNDPAAVNAALETVAIYLNTKPPSVEAVIVPKPTPVPTPAPSPQIVPDNLPNA